MNEATSEFEVRVNDGSCEVFGRYKAAHIVLWPFKVPWHGDIGLAAVLMLKVVAWEPNTISTLF